MVSNWQRCGNASGLECLPPLCLCWLCWPCNPAVRVSKAFRPPEWRAIGPHFQIAQAMSGGCPAVAGAAQVHADVEAGAYGYAGAGGAGRRALEKDAHGALAQPYQSGGHAYAQPGQRLGAQLEGTPLILFYFVLAPCAGGIPVQDTCTSAPRLRRSAACCRF